MPQSRPQHRRQGDLELERAASGENVVLCPCFVVVICLSLALAVEDSKSYFSRTFATCNRCDQTCKSLCAQTDGPVATTRKTRETLDNTPPPLGAMAALVDGQGPFNVGDCISVLAWRFDEKEDRRENRWRCAPAASER